MEVIDFISDSENIVILSKICTNLDKGICDTEETQGIGFGVRLSRRLHPRSADPQSHLRPARLLRPQSPRRERLRAGSAGSRPCQREAWRAGRGNHPDEGGVGTCVAWQRLKGQQLKPFRHFCAPTIASRGSAPSSRLESGFWSGNIESGVCGAIRAHADGPAGPQEARNPDVQERLLYGSHFSAASITDRR